MPSEISMIDIYKDAVPFMIMQMIVLAFCIIFPEQALFLPNLVK